MNYFVVFVIIATEMNFLKSFIPCYITTEFFSTTFVPKSAFTDNKPL